MGRKRYRLDIEHRRTPPLAESGAIRGLPIGAAAMIGRVAAAVLHVCLANQCRSPLAEALMRRRLAERGLADVVRVSSAGVRARPGRAIWPPAAQWAAEQGLPVSGITSRAMTPAMVAEADLVLAATRALRDVVLAQAPTALRRTFTWRELAWLLDGVSPADLAGADAAARLRALPALALSRRGRRPAVDPEDLDVIDPVDRDPSVLPVAAGQIDSAVSTVVDLIVV